MKKGFTLIEMLGIITVLAIALLVTFPALNSSLKKMQENKDNNATNNLKVSAESYIELNRNKYPELYKPYGKAYIKVQELYDAELLKGKNDNLKMDDIITVLATSDLQLKFFFNNKQIGYGVDPNDNSLDICDNVTTFCISSRSDLEQLATQVNNGDNKSGKTYILTTNIDLGGLFDSDGNPLEGNNPWTPIGSQSKPFSGTFEGAGHIITGMYIDSTTENTGLFSYIAGGTVKNLGIENSYIKSTQQNTGSIVGKITNDGNKYGNILNCYNKATVSGKKTSAGIVGSSIISIIKNCYNAGQINSNGQQFAAGIVGYVSNTNSVVENCYNAGTINGAIQAGGIIGGLQGKAFNNYNLGSVAGGGGGGIIGQLYAPTSPIAKNNYNIGTEVVAGIIGTITSTGNYTVTNNYFLNTSTTYGIYSTSSNVGASPLTINEMPNVISVINGDNAYVEDIKGINGGYPILKCQQQ